jgi:hypothetical protein
MVDLQLRDKPACDQLEVGAWQSRLTLFKVRLKNLLRLNRKQRREGLIATELAKRLWCFSQYALRDLERLRCSTSAAEERSTAAWQLCRWYHGEKDYARALDYVVFMRNIYPQVLPSKKLCLFEVDCLLGLGRIQEARWILERELKDSDFDSDLYLAAANTHVSADASTTSCEDDAARLEWINRIYNEAGLLPLVKADPFRALAIDNLATLDAPSKTEADHKVSVIVPSYNAQDTLPFALRGLLAQTWQNLEIIIVDDCSTDATFAVAESFACRDQRVIPLRQAQNQGAYAARNKGLEIATGDFITVNDADDWSHPQKIELQVTALKLKPPALANISDWSRTLFNLRFTGTSRPPGLVRKNRSSILFRRDVFALYGVWDKVRTGADSEFCARLEKEAGTEWIDRVLPSVPLSFALDSSSSLTRSGLTHIRTNKFGVRREYKESAAHWHASCSGQLRLDPHPEARPFPVPTFILPQRQNRAECDVLFLMDFNVGGGAFDSTMHCVNAALAQGLSVALFHWPRYDSDVTKPLNAEIRKMAQECKLRIIAPGEKVYAPNVILGDPRILEFAIDLCPEVEFVNFVAIHNQTSACSYTDDSVQYDPRVVRENLRELFGTEGTWVPISALVGSAIGTLAACQDEIHSAKWGHSHHRESKM